MFKWIIGILAALLLLALGFCWYGFKQVTAGGDTARVAILASPERVWAYLAHPDSLARWQDSSTTLTASTDSLLVAGDTVWLRGRNQAGTGSERMRWVIERVNAPWAIVMKATDDSTGMEIVRRTDSIAIAGDSTILLSRFAPTIIDSIQAADTSGGLGQRLLGAAGRITVGAMRAIAELDQARLKRMLERN
jgi:uncharacterized protein YndB with AHSA1/START domain